MYSIITKYLHVLDMVISAKKKIKIIIIIFKAFHSLESWHIQFNKRKRWAWRNVCRLCEFMASSDLYRQSNSIDPLTMQILSLKKYIYIFIKSLICLFFWYLKVMYVLLQLGLTALGQKFIVGPLLPTALWQYHYFVRHPETNQCSRAEIISLFLD